MAVVGSEAVLSGEEGRGGVLSSEREVEVVVVAVVGEGAGQDNDALAQIFLEV